MTAVQTKISDFTASVKPSQTKESNIQDNSKRDMYLNSEVNERVSSTTGSSNLISVNKGFPKCPTKRKDIEPSTAESSLKRSKRGDPICSIEDVNVKDIGLLYQKSATLTDAERYDLLKNHWNPDKSFEFPCSQEGSSKRKFNFNLLARFPWLACSKFNL